MDHNKKHVSIRGKQVTFQTGHIARLAGGSVTVECGETILLATACRGPMPAENTDFLPLRVDYQEKFSSTGKTLGGFIKREGRPTEKETLVCRLIDRPIRPMFPDAFYEEVQVICYVLSYDGVHPPESLAISAASAALVLSDIPLIKPIAGVRVGLIREEIVINPTCEEMKQSSLDLMLAGTEDAILMIEGYCNFLSDEQVLKAIEEGHQEIQKICQTLDEWQKEKGVHKREGSIHPVSADLKEKVTKFLWDDLVHALSIKNKVERNHHLGILVKTFMEHATSQNWTQEARTVDLLQLFKATKSAVMRHEILKKNKRIDGRTSTQIRPISIHPHLLPRTHGSALFTRGETQALCVCTLGGENSAQRFEDLNGESSRRFYLQYSFPPFSVGEVGRLGSPGRRELGHGKLAENALSAILPASDKFPYVIRLESTITESNGSSSMASICGGCLALMDAGVPIKAPIAGIAMGLILEDSSHFAILSDILGDEDALGDMDFKIAGNHTGITAFQMDIKVEGISHKIMEAVLKQAREGIQHILGEMHKACATTREELSPYAPRIETIQVKSSKIGTIIGPGGKNIRAIIESSKAQVDISDDGVVSIAATSAESMESAKNQILNLIAELEIGKTYKGQIVSIVDFGIFVKIFDKEGLCHISEFDHQRMDSLKNVCKIGDSIEVKVLDINERGQVKLSRKALLPPPSQPSSPQKILK